MGTSEKYSPSANEDILIWSKALEQQDVVEFVSSICTAVKSGQCIVSYNWIIVNQKFSAPLCPSESFHSTEWNLWFPLNSDQILDWEAKY